MLWLLTACVRGPILEGSADPFSCDEAFDDHTHVGEAEVSDLLPLVEPPRSDWEVKFLITNLMDEERRQVRFHDANFYRYHDEWYWYRLLNGVEACGATTDPVELEDTFETVSDVYAWARQQDELPLDLRWVGLFDDRLYSPSFYSLVFRSTPRAYATGEARFRPQDEAFRLILDPTDDASTEEEASIRAALEDALPLPLLP